MNTPIRGWAAHAAKGEFKPFEYTPGALHPEQVEIAVESCGICHSDLSMLDNEWGRTVYPFVPGHENVGTVTAVGAQAKGLAVGDRVGIGWISATCMHCRQCMGGDHHLCGTKEETIVGRHGGFAERLRAHWSCAIKLPQGLQHGKAGPLFCGGITVFTPILEYVQPQHRVGVIGIGGLGHMALQFLNKWGCEVTAFTSSESKREEAMKLGAHRVVASTDKAALKALSGQLDFILVTVNVAMDWSLYTRLLGPRGRLHFVGAVMEPLNVQPRLLFSQKAISGSPVGSPAAIATLLDFCARHDLAPMTETFAMSEVNAAMEHLRAGKARYRIVLKNDFS
jgi:alcohol/geraniol dehydrogenase (NADP+)